MIEVFVFGVFVAYVKLSDLVTIGLAAGVYALLADLCPRLDGCGPRPRSDMGEARPRDAADGSCHAASLQSGLGGRDRLRDLRARQRAPAL